MAQNKLNLKIDDSTNKILHGLNDAQHRAVKHKSGPLLIIAGAGTGKTSVITRRIAYIIEQKWAQASEIIALTFTEKAAAEMEERVDMLVPYGFTDMWISTFHAFGDRFLRDYSLDIGLPANFKVLSATEQIIFMRDHLYAFDLTHFRPTASPTSHIQALLGHFSRLKDELITPDEYIVWAENNIQELSTEQADKELIVEAEKTLELANAYRRYQELMIQSGNLDYGDQLYLVNKVLDENPTILKKLRAKFKYILVDEFQDTNYAQNELIKKLAGKDGNITVVGDDDQSIYRFRGASISNILQFNDDYQNVTQIVLNQNYRSTQQILDAAYRLIQHNNPDRLEVKNKINKRLLADKTGPNPELLHCVSLTCEADLVAKKITELKSSHDYDYKDFAILVRANSQAEPFIQSLNLAGIPHIFSGSSSLLQRPEIRMLVSFLRLLINPDDHLSFFHLLTSEIYKVDNKLMGKLFTQSRFSHRNIEELIESETDYQEIRLIVEDLKLHRDLVNSDTAGEILYKFLTNKGVLKRWIESGTVEDEIKMYNTASFFERIANFDHASTDRSTAAFLIALELIIEAGDDTSGNEIDANIDAVNILSAHASKGLEYKAVFVVNLVSDRFPNKRKGEGLIIPPELIKERLPEGDFHTQEERRLFYVAVTRAKEFLFITSGDDYGGKRTKKLSPFVMELFGEANPNTLTHRLDPIQKIERFKKLTTPAVSPIAINERRENLRLSRQQIDDYDTCPQKYYLAHIIRIPLLENQFLMYGTAIHAALNNHFTRKALAKTLTLEELINDFKTAFRNVGFITRQHEELRFSEGIETLTRFFQQDSLDTRIPHGIETSFEFLEGKIKVNGRYDLVYKDNDEFEICDFKTSNVKDQKDANRRIKTSTQMQMYALSWFRQYGIIPKTTLYFIESGLKGEATFSEKELEKTTATIESVAEGILAQSYDAKPELRACQQCAYSQICPESIV